MRLARSAGENKEPAFFVEDRHADAVVTHAPSDLGPKVFVRHAILFQASRFQPHGEGEGEHDGEKSRGGADDGLIAKIIRKRFRPEDAAAASTQVATSLG